MFKVRKTLSSRFFPITTDDLDSTLKNVMVIDNFQVNSREAKTTKCPDCQADIPIEAGYRQWCDQCNWNVQTPLEVFQPQTLADHLHLRLSHKYSEHLLETIKALPSEALKPKVNLNAFLVATGVHLLAVALAALGVYLLVSMFSNLFAVFGGLICLGLAWLARPRFGKLPEAIADREDFPHLYKLVEDVASEMNAPSVDAIVLEHDFNAAYGEFGFKRTKVLFLGLPLLNILKDDELVALIGHELAHGVNGDPGRSTYIGTAIDTLLTWSKFLRPRFLWEPGSGLSGFFMIPLKLVYLAVAESSKWIAHILLSFSWKNSQRSEYLADYLGTKIAGAQGMTAMLEKMHYRNAFNTTLQQIALGNPDKDFFQEFKTYVSEMPVREIERLRRLQQLSTVRLDTTHPPTIHRLTFLNQHSHLKGEFSLSDFESQELREELKKVQKKLQRRMVDRFRASLYH